MKSYCTTLKLKDFIFAEHRRLPLRLVIRPRIPSLRRKEKLAEFAITFPACNFGLLGGNLLVGGPTQPTRYGFPPLPSTRGVISKAPGSAEGSHFPKKLDQPTTPRSLAKGG